MPPALAISSIVAPGPTERITAIAAASSSSRRASRRSLTVSPSTTRATVAGPSSLPWVNDPRGAPTMTLAQFSAMTEGTQEDWTIIATHALEFATGLADRVISHLRLLDGDFGGFKVDRLPLSLQTATRAYRAGRDDEYVACALLHDIGDTLGSLNPADIGAAIVKPFVGDAYHWM